jgi:hypothetical protein
MAQLRAARNETTGPRRHSSGGGFWGLQRRDDLGQPRELLEAAALDVRRRPETHGPEAACGRTSDGIPRELEPWGKLPGWVAAHLAKTGATQAFMISAGRLTAVKAEFKKR